MKVSLLMVSADGTAKEFSADHLPLVIGRGHECKLRIPVDSVSRAHCELAENEDEELVIRDLKSSNGTYVNRERVRERELVPGDLISIGPVVFVVKIDGHPRDVDANTAFTKGKVAVGGGAEAMIDGVPTWSGALPKKPGGAPGAGGKGGPGGGGGAGGGGGLNIKPKGGLGKDDSGGFEGLLKDLSESDFDIKFPDDDDPPKPKK